MVLWTSASCHLLRSTFHRFLSSVSGPGLKERDVFENYSRFNLRVIGSVTAASVTGTAMCVALDITEGSEAAVEELPLWKKLSRTSICLGLFAFSMLTLLAYVPQKYVTRLSLVNMDGIKLNVETWAPMGIRTKLRTFPINQLSTPDAAPKVEDHLWTFKMRNQRRVYAVDREKGNVKDIALLKAIVRGPEQVIKMIDRHMVIRDSPGRVVVSKSARKRR